MNPNTTNTNINTNLNTAITSAPRDPSWWTNEHETGWERMKELLAHEDSEEKGTRTGAMSGSNFSEAVPALRYGYGARQRYGAPTPIDWNSVEPKLAKEWETLGHSREWQHARGDIKRGWESHTRHTHPRTVAGVQSMGSGLGASSPGDSGSGSGA